MSTEHRSSSMICNEGRSAMREGAPSTERSAMRDDDDDDEDEQATAMTSELRVT